MSLIKKNYSKFSCQEFNSNLSNDIDKKAMNITEELPFLVYFLSRGEGGDSLLRDLCDELLNLEFFPIRHSDALTVKYLNCLIFL